MVKGGVRVRGWWKMVGADERELGWRVEGNMADRWGVGALQTDTPMSLEGKTVKTGSFDWSDGQISRNLNTTRRSVRR